MSEIQAVDANVAAVAPVDDLAAPRKGMWQRFEPAILGCGSIAVLLLVWEFLPRLITMQEGTKLFFTVPSEIGGTLWRMFATGAIWGPLSVSASAFAIGLAIAIAVGLPVGVLPGGRLLSMQCSIPSSPPSMRHHGWCSCRSSYCGSGLACGQRS